MAGVSDQVKKRKSISDGEKLSQATHKKLKKGTADDGSYKKKGGSFHDSSKEASVILDRRERKALSEARKKARKPNYDLEKTLVSQWEKLRQRNIEPAERSKMTTALIAKMKGKLPELAVSHTCSRVVQSCVKHCSAEERAEMFVELRPHCAAMARNTYAHHLVNKMLEYGTKEQRAQMLTLFHGQTVALLRHPVASHVVEQAFQLANAAQKQTMVSEFYSPEFRLFKDETKKSPGRLADVLAGAPEAKKRSILEHITLAIQPIVEKGIVDHSIVHRALNEFLMSAPPRLWADVVEQLSGPLLVRMLHTRDGAQVACTCVAAGTAKERKKIVKGLKEHVNKIARDDYGNLVLLQILDSVDDTMLVRKSVISELMKELPTLASHKYGRRLLLHLLAPRVPRYFPADVIALLQRGAASQKDTSTVGKSEGAAEEEAGVVSKEEEEEEDEGEVEEGIAIGGSKKDPEVRRWELLHGSKLDLELVNVCKKNAGELLRSQFGTDVIFEVANGAVGGILYRGIPAELKAVHEAIAELAAHPRHSASVKSQAKKAGGEERLAEEEHVLENFFASRTIQRLIQQPSLAAESSDLQPFAAILWEKALSGRCGQWAEGHSAKILAAMANCDHKPTQAKVIAELQPMVAKGLLDPVKSKLPAGVFDVGLDAKPATMEGSESVSKSVVIKKKGPQAEVKPRQAEETQLNKPMVKKVRRKVVQ